MKVLFVLLLFIIWTHFDKQTTPHTHSYSYTSRSYIRCAACQEHVDASELHCSFCHKTWGDHELTSLQYKEHVKECKLIPVNRKSNEKVRSKRRVYYFIYPVMLPFYCYKLPKETACEVKGFHRYSLMI
jgi:hypothetical protein